LRYCRGRHVADGRLPECLGDLGTRIRAG
jgi:hypothetical protein